MQPSKSDLYEYNLISVPGSFPRHPGSILLSRESHTPSDYRLQVCYRKYKALQDSNKPKINIVFLHGNGMNKGIWHYHIDKLYNQYNNSEYQLNTVLAIDNVSHGESAAANKDKLGYVYGWKDGCKDVIEIVKYHESQDFLSKNSINILVGHSLGGFQALYTCYLEPQLFDACIPVNPVCYMDDQTLALYSFGFGMWLKTDKIKSHFDIPEGSNWKEVAEKHYKKESFFKKFNPAVLANMLGDEFSGVTPEGNSFDLNTRAEQEYICYYNARVFIPDGMKVFDQITTPVYHIVGDNDTAGEGAIQSTRSSLKSVVKPFDLENSTHLVVGENPDLVVNVLLTAINQITQNHAKNGSVRFSEDKWLRQYGENYKEVVMAKEIDTYVAAHKNYAKL